MYHYTYYTLIQIATLPNSSYQPPEIVIMIRYDNYHIRCR